MSLKKLFPDSSLVISGQFSSFDYAIGHMVDVFPWTRKYVKYVKDMYRMGVPVITSKDFYPDKKEFFRIMLRVAQNDWYPVVSVWIVEL